MQESNEYVSQTQRVRSFERIVRTLKFSVEEMHGVTLLPNHPLLVWAVMRARLRIARTGTLLSPTEKRYRFSETSWQRWRSDMVIVMDPKNGAQNFL